MRADGIQVLAGGSDFEVGDLTGRRIGIWGKRVDPVAHAGAEMAAPPAPAMITSIARSEAVEAYSAIQIGVRWAGHYSALMRHVEASEDVSGVTHYVQSDLLPMITPTKGLTSGPAYLVALLLLPLAQ
jgi:hypothetical protein